MPAKTTGSTDSRQFSVISWKGDDGFYYSRYPKPDEKEKMTDQNKNHKVYYHKIGTTQNEDLPVYEDKDHPLRITGAWLTEDQRFLTLSISEGTSGSELWVKDLENKSSKNDFVLLIKGFDTESEFIDNMCDLPITTRLCFQVSSIFIIPAEYRSSNSSSTIFTHFIRINENFGHGL